MIPLEADEMTADCLVYEAQNHRVYNLLRVTLMCKVSATWWMAVGGESTSRNFYAPKIANGLADVFRGLNPGGHSNLLNCQNLLEQRHKSLSTLLRQTECTFYVHSYKEEPRRDTNLHFSLSYPIHRESIFSSYR